MIIEDQEAILLAIRQSTVIAVVGVSADEERPSYLIAQGLMAYHRFRIYLVNPVYAGKEILGHTVLASLKDVPEHMDIVDVFRRSDAIEPILQEALECQAGLVWLQPGTEDLQVISRYAERINIVFNACLGVMAARI